MDDFSKQKYLVNDAIRKVLERSNETKEETDVRKLADACRHFESRANESNLQYESRISAQNLTQKKLLSKETPEQTKARQAVDSIRKVKKRAKKAAAYENSYKPNEDWNLHLDSDMIRHRNSRKNETEEKRNLRKQKDADYQKKRRWTDNERHQKRMRKKEYDQMKKRDSTAKKSAEWTEVHRQNNLQELRKSGSYYRFLYNGIPRDTFFGRSLPSPPEIADDWKWLINKIYNATTMGYEFFTQSKKAALLFQQYGLNQQDVVHVITGSHNSTLSVLGGTWILGGVCSLSDKSDIETIKHQVS